MTTANGISESKIASFHRVKLLIECLVLGFDGANLYFLTADDGDNLPCVPVEREQSLDLAAHEFCKTVLRQKDIFVQQLNSCDEVVGMNRERLLTISYVYCVFIPPTAPTLALKKWKRIISPSEINDPVQKRIQAAISQLQTIFWTCPASLSLLPEKFTISQLCRLYELIFSREIDDGNFRKKMTSTNLLIKLNEKEKSSKKGAFYYTFKKECRGIEPG